MHLSIFVKFRSFHGARRNQCAHRDTGRGRDRPLGPGRLNAHESTANSPLPPTNFRRSPASQARTPARKSSNGGASRRTEIGIPHRRATDWLHNELQAWLRFIQPVASSSACRGGRRRSPIRLPARWSRGKARLPNSRRRAGSPDSGVGDRRSRR